MSEEKPVFKVRDRRLFNPDGTPREAHDRDEEQTTSSSSSNAVTASSSPASSTSTTAQPSAVAGTGEERAASSSSSSSAAGPQSPDAATASTSSSSHAPAGAGAQSQPSPPQQQPAREARGSASAASGAHASAAPEGFGAEGEEGMDELPGAEDPASFVNFLMSIASNAAAALGMMEHPATGQRGVDLQLGKHWIDVLSMLHEKTRGNLVAQEQQILEGILADLRMQYVSLTSARQARPSGPRGFTGRDIIGGK